MPTKAKPQADGGCIPAQRAFWLSLGLPYCEKCCNPRSTSADGSTLCRIDDPVNCPLIKKE